MTRFEKLLGTDFDGEPTTGIDDVIDSASEDPRHRERVPGLIELMHDPGEPAGQSTSRRNGRQADQAANWGRKNHVIRHPWELAAHRLPCRP